MNRRQEPVGLTKFEMEALEDLLAWLKSNGPPLTFAMRNSQKERDLTSALQKIADRSIQINVHECSSCGYYKCMCDQQ